MKTRLKTAFFYGILMAILVIPGYFIPDVTVLLLMLVAYFAPRELTKALANVDIKINKFLLHCFSFSFIPCYIYIKLTNPTIYSGRTVYQSQVESSFINEIDSGLFLRLFTIYGIFLLICTGYAIFKPLLSKGSQSIPEIVAQLSAGYYLSIPLFFGFSLLFNLPGGWFWFVLALATPWISDSAAFFSGVLWGKKPIVPALSPKKTYVGFFGSMIGTAIVYVPVFIFFVPKLYPVPVNTLTVILVVLFAAAISAVIELGDWLASGIKRYCGIKDFSNLLPGHGGVIDRFDSTFFTFTAILAIALLIYFF